MELDELDSEILKELMDYSRISYRELSRQLGVSVGTIHNRIKKFLDNKIIMKFTIELNKKNIGYNIKAIFKIFPKFSKTEIIFDKLKYYHTNDSETISQIYMLSENEIICICNFKELNNYYEFLKKINTFDFDNINDIQHKLIIEEFKK